VLVQYNTTNNKTTTETINDVRFEASRAVTMKNGVFWDVTPYTRATRRNIPEDTILKN
jgi:hypothetical protein